MDPIRTQRSNISQHFEKIRIFSENQKQKYDQNDLSRHFCFMFSRIQFVMRNFTKILESIPDSSRK